MGLDTPAGAYPALPGSVRLPDDRPTCRL